VNLLTRYILNGITATTVHFAILTFNVEVVHFKLVGNANLVAALIASTVAFFGNRHFVFKKSEKPIFAQAAKFGGLYLAMATFHGFGLFIWSDIFQLGYRNGFVLVTALQIIIGYFGNKFLVFKL